MKNHGKKQDNIHRCYVSDFIYSYVDNDQKKVTVFA